MRFLLGSVVLLTTVGFYCRGGDFAPEIPAPLQTNATFQKLMFVPPTYRTEALRLIIDDANRTAQQLGLPEELPITETNMIGCYISPPRLARGAGTIGTVSTGHYLYAPFVARGFVVVRRDLEQQEAQMRAEYLWPTNRMDKATAYDDAVEILRKGDIAVNALNDNCVARVTTCIPEGQSNHFVPIYWVTWSEKHPGPLSQGASVELFEPTKMILQLQVTGSRYILRKPLEVTNADFILSQTNTPPAR
jgi:hypothetical protein